MIAVMRGAGSGLGAAAPGRMSGLGGLGGYLAVRGVQA